MENQPSKIDKAVKISIIVGTLIVALSIAYYLVIFLPKKAEMALEQRAQEQQAEADEVVASRNALNDCLGAVEAYYAENWERNCRSQDLGEECSLPKQTAERLNDDKKREQDNCFKKFPQ